MKRPALRDRLAASLMRAEVDGHAIEPLLTLLDRLALPEAPTSVHDPAEGVDVHVADSLSGLDVPAVRSAALLADLGAGAGPPGLVLAAALPSTEIVLVESLGRKCDFLRATAEAMGLPNVTVVCARAEEWDDGRARCDVVTARALAALPVVCEYAAPLLGDGGSLVAWKGAVDDTEAADGAAAAAVLGLTPEPVRRVMPFPGAQRRSLHVFRKTAPTPGQYPRRAGIATKRPLTATKRS